MREGRGGACRREEGKGSSDPEGKVCASSSPVSGFWPEAQRGAQGQSLVPEVEGASSDTG